MVSDFRKLKALNALEWRALAWALILLPLLRISLKFWSFQSVFSTLGKTAPLPAVQRAPEGETLPQLEVSSVARMVNVAANRGPVKARCLPRSMAAWWLLRRRGMDCELKLGVAPRDASIQAHAWVEYRGRVLNDEPAMIETYLAFDRVSVDR